MTTATSQQTIVLMHGLYLTARSWEHWVERYQSRGFRVLAPNWPGLEGEVEALRADPAPLKNMRVEDVLDHYERIIRQLDQPPIIMGHSFGGAFTQVLVSRGLGAAAVGIAPGTVRGVRDLPLVTIKSNLRILRNPLIRKAAIMPTEKEFRFAFTNTFSEASAKAAYERYAVAGSRNVLFSGANAQLNPGTALKVDWKKRDRAPFLFIAGGQDHVVPASANRSNYKKYVKANSGAITAIKEYPSRGHFTAVDEGWEAVADFALDWALNPVAGVLQDAPRQAEPVRA